MTHTAHLGRLFLYACMPNTTCHYLLSSVNCDESRARACPFPTLPCSYRLLSAQDLEIPVGPLSILLLFAMWSLLDLTGMSASQMENGSGSQDFNLHKLQAADMAHLENISQCDARVKFRI